MGAERRLSKQGLGKSPPEKGAPPPAHSAFHLSPRFVERLTTEGRLGGSPLPDSRPCPSPFVPPPEAPPPGPSVLGQAAGIVRAEEWRLPGQIKEQRFPPPPPPWPDLSRCRGKDLRQPWREQLLAQGAAG